MATNITDLKKNLQSNLWQENLNVWKFQEKIFTIKKYSGPDLTTSVEYSIEGRPDNEFVLKTNDGSLGNFILSLSYDNSFPRLFLQSLNHENLFFELQAFKMVSGVEKSLIESRVKELKKVSDQKKNEIMIKIQHLQKSSSTEKDTMKELAAAVFKLGQIDGRINTLENVINSTINLTTNFDVYQKNVLNDISSLEAELNNIF